MLPRSQLAPHAIARWAQERSDQVAVMRVDSGAALTYGDLHDQALRWAAAYQRLGVGAGSHVATMIPNSAEAYVAWLGLGWLRAIEVPLNNGYTGKMLQYTLSQSDSTMLVIHRRFVDRLASIAAELPQLERVVVLDDPASAESPVAENDFDIATLPFDVSTQQQFLDGVAPAAGLDGPEYRDITAIIYTSGTTGPSKGVILPWAGMLNMWSWVPAETFGAGEALYGAFPSFHVERQVGVQRSDGTRAASSVLSREVQRDALLGRRSPHQLRVGVGLVGPMTALLWAQPNRADDADNPLRNVLLGPMIPEMDAFEKRFDRARSAPATA